MLKYTPSSKSTNRNRARKVIWFNPPYCRSVKTKLGAEFLKLLDNCFPKSHTHHKVMNRNSVKVSPSYMPNVRTQISDINKKKLTDEQQNDKY